jgi:DNA ligase-1
MMTTVTLYKKDTKGKIRYVVLSAQLGIFTQESGVVNTENPIFHRKVCTSKNVGKSNVTSPVEQALLEMSSKLAEKLTEGYFYTEQEAQTNDVILPMLAKDYNKESKKVDWNAFVCVQPKLDGMRCLAYKVNGEVQLISRQGEHIQNMDHIKVMLSDLAEDVILDGELYAHGNTFQENMSLIKKYKPAKSETVKLNVYDLVEQLPYIDRLSKLNKTVEVINNESLLLVTTYKINSEKELKQYHIQFIKEGYEGTILRHGNANYKVDARSSNLLKYKDFQDITAEIIDVIPAEARPEWGIPVLNIPQGTFRAGTKLSHVERADLLTNKEDYIGKTAEIRFFEYTDDGLPRFPVMVGIRLDK